MISDVLSDAIQDINRCEYAHTTSVQKVLLVMFAQQLLLDYLSPCPCFGTGPTDLVLHDIAAALDHLDVSQIQTAVKSWLMLCRTNHEGIADEREKAKRLALLQQRLWICEPILPTSTC